MAGLGAAFLTARPPVVRVAVIAGVVLCLAGWVLIEDLGFLGGVGTDPNSMIPMILLFVAGYLALTRSAPSASQSTPATPAAAVLWRERPAADPTYTFRTIGRSRRPRSLGGAPTLLRPWLIGTPRGFCGPTLEFGVTAI